MTNDQELVGTHEIAIMADVGLATVADWIMHRPQGFPEPYATLRSGTIYLKAEIEKWLSATGRNTR